MGKRQFATIGANCLNLYIMKCVKINRNKKFGFYDWRYLSMKIVAINASPRVQWNTSSLVREAAKGAETEGAEMVKNPWE